MTTDAILVLQSLFVDIWSLFTSFEIPGTHATPAEVGFLVLAVSLIIRIVRHFLSLDGGSK